MWPLTPNGQDLLKRWLPTLVLLVGWTILAGVQWGSVNARVAAVEKQNDGKLDKREYDLAREDLVRRLDRIEIKIDRLNQ